MRGNGFTDPSCVASYIPENFAGEPLTLYLFTDGQVDASCVEKCDSILKNSNVRFEKVYIHIWNTGGDINLSVSAPFTRFCEFEIYRDKQKLVGGRSDLVIDLKEWEDVDYFLANKQQLQLAITMQNLGKMNNELRKALLELKKKLFFNFMDKTSIGFDNPVVEALENNYYAYAIKE